MWNQLKGHRWEVRELAAIFIRPKADVKGDNNLIIKNNHDNTVGTIIKAFDECVSESSKQNQTLDVRTYKITQFKIWIK